MIGADPFGSGLDHQAVDRAYRRALDEAHAKRCEPCGKLRDRVTAFDAQFMRGMQRANQIAPQHRGSFGKRTAPEDTAFRTHSGGAEFLQHRQRLGPARNHQQATLMHRNPSRPDQPGPDIARPFGPPPHQPLFLAGDGDKAKIADRCTMGPRLTLHHRDTQARAQTSERVGQAHDPSTDNNQMACHHSSLASRTAVWPRLGRRLGITSRQLSWGVRISVLPSMAIKVFRCAMISPPR